MVARLKEFFSQWEHDHARAFPWRGDQASPFGILVAEMLLRQTRAEMVAETWPGLMERFPDAGAFASARDEELYEELSGLGFGRQRVEAIKSMSRALLDEHGGIVPRSLEDLLALPHVGLYAAHAVLCFAFGQRLPVVDSNVLRVLSRLTGEDYGRDIRRGRSDEAWELARAILPRRAARAHNYGLLDFAAQVCKPRKPDCDHCPLASQCAYYQASREL